VLEKGSVPFFFFFYFFKDAFMSMPQYLEVAVVGKEEKLVKTITKGVPISQPGIAPKYHLVSLSPATHKRFTEFESLNFEHVLVWIALDKESASKCKIAINKNKSRKNYERGFYDYHLPDSLLFATSNKEFHLLTTKIYEAFCATS
jgi:hypothetical protein